MWPYLYIQIAVPLRVGFSVGLYEVDEGVGMLEVQVELFSGESEATLTIHTVDDSATGTVYVLE